jgi:hypothetical protein
MFARLPEGSALEVHYEINGHQYDKWCYLAHGIYPKWSIFVKTICIPKRKKYRMFAKEQEACRKNMEQAFGVLQSRQAIVWYTSRTWSHETTWEVMTACMIVHNIIVENEL